MLARTCIVLGVFRPTVKHHSTLPLPCAQRWTLHLAKAKLWNEYMDQNATVAWQLEDERHMSPEMNDFVGYRLRGMRPGLDGMARPEMILQSKLPTASFHEIAGRRDVPFQSNVMWGRELHDQTIHGMTMPYLYKMRKEIAAADRNDKTIKKIRFRSMMASGVKNPPSNFKKIADPTDGEE